MKVLTMNLMKPKRQMKEKSFDLNISKVKNKRIKH